MAITKYLPFSGSVQPDSVEVTTESIDVKLPIKARGVRPRNVSGYWFGSRGKTTTRAEFEDCPFDFNRISRAIDTDSYVRQAFGKYRDLFWKEGWTLTGENEAALTYVWTRIDIMEQSMGQSFETFLGEVVDQLLKYSNVFIVKARADVSKYAKGARPLTDDEKLRMVAGYYIIPTETVRIKRDAYNRPLSYAQQLDPQSLGNPMKKDMIVWDAEDVIHLYLDRKPGRMFGTPFCESTLDDVISLRSMEENILNLVDRELMPLYIYKVGNDSFPAKEGELDEAVTAIEMLKAEGGLVAPGNHSVEVIGAEGNSLEIADYLAHFKERVAIGLGVSPHHLGMMGTSSNRSVTERLDLALYDKIKTYQGYLENALRIYVFNPILEEGGFTPTGNVNNLSSLDTCYFEFREIDIDTQIKKENHYIDMFLKSAITWEELRSKLNLPKQADSDNIYMLMEAKIQAYIMEVQAAVAPTPVGASSATKGSAPKPSASRPDAKKSVGKGMVNLPNMTKDTGNKDRPINQHGRLQSPNIKNQLDGVDVFMENLKDILDEEEIE